MILDITSRFLERTGKIETICCNSADEACKVLQTREIDVIVSDYDMPYINGIEFLSCVRNSGCSIPFILYTGRGREEVVIEALNNGATHYLRKGGEPKSQYAELVNIICQISEKIRSKQEVREKEHLIATIFEHLPDPTYAIDLQGRIIAWNRAMENVTGIIRERAEDVSEYKQCLPFYATTHRVPADILLEKREDLPRDFTLLLRTEEMIISELCLENTEKKQVTYWIKTSRLFNGSGIFNGIIESIRDITAEKKAESDLIKMSRYHRTLIEAHIDPLITIERDLKISDVNKATEISIGYPLQTLIGTSFSSWFVEGGLVEEVCRNVLNQTSQAHELPLNLKTKYGIIPVLLFATSCPDEDQHGEKIFAEIHERKLN
ncbi:MAG: PAS domain S-box protein [Methanospirillum sp.]|nr:PAS domain S-box protein [Methanospirillum sp.]